MQITKRLLPVSRPSSVSAKQVLPAVAWTLFTAAGGGLIVEPVVAAEPDPTPVLAPVKVRAQVEDKMPTRSRAGSKTDTPLIETPQSISVVPRAQIESQGAATVGQALRYTAGVVAEWRGLSSSKYDHILVRGSAGYTVDMYWDGLRLPSIGSIGGPTPDPYFLERIEVLKGPASVLYGQGAANGLVNAISKRPTPDARREVRFSIGNNGYRWFGLDLGGPVDDAGQFLYRVVSVGLDSDSPIDSAHEKRFGIAPSLTWQPTDDTALTLYANYQHDPDLGYYDTRPAIGTAFHNPLGKVPSDFNANEPRIDASDRKYITVGYEFEHRIDDTWNVRQNLRYVDADYDWQAVAFQSLQADNRTADRYASHLMRSGLGLELDNQTQARFETGPVEHTVLIGVDYQWENTDSVNYAGTATPIDIFDPVYGGAVNFAPKPRGDSNQKIRQTGIYLQEQARYGNGSLLFGGRHDHASSQSSNRLNGTATRLSDEATTWRAGFVYQFANGIAPYGSYSHSFQPVGGLDADGRPFEPARGKQYEAGIKIQPRNGKALFTVAAFDLTEDNLTTPDDSNLGFNTQLGEVRTRGAEFEGRFVIADSLTVIAAYTYLDNEITHGAAAETGKSRPNTPRHTASLWADYNFNGGLQGLGIGAGVRYVGASPANIAESPDYFEAPAYTLADLNAHYDLGAALRGVRLELSVKNLFDRDYVGSCGGKNPASGYCWAGYPRTVIGTVGYRW